MYDEQNILLPYPYGTCANQTLRYYDDYSRSRCQMECFTQFLIEECNCTDTYSPGDASYLSRSLVFSIAKLSSYMI